MAAMDTGHALSSDMKDMVKGASETSVTPAWEDLPAMRPASTMASSRRSRAAAMALSPALIWAESIASLDLLWNPVLVITPALISRRMGALLEMWKALVLEKVRALVLHWVN